MQAEVIAAYIAAGVAMLSTVLNIWQFRVNRKDQLETNLDKTLFESLNWFEGGAQKRSIGIAIIEGYWEQKKRKMVKVWKPLLINQAIHLFNESEHPKSKTEETNIKRIMTLLCQIPLNYDENNTIIEVVENANTPGNAEPKGLIINPNDKQSWLAILKNK